MAQKMAIAGTKWAIDNHFDRIPDRYFKGDTYTKALPETILPLPLRPKNKDKKDSRRDKDRRERDRKDRPRRTRSHDRRDSREERSDRRRSRERRRDSRDEYKDRRDDSREDARRSRRDTTGDAPTRQSRPSSLPPQTVAAGLGGAALATAATTGYARYPHDPTYPAGQYYPPSDSPQPPLFVQGDPRFAQYSQQQQPAFGQPFYLPSDASVQGDPNFGKKPEYGVDEKAYRDETLNMAEYPPAGGYHRYNPADYQPNEYAQEQQHDNRHGQRSGYQVDEYQRPPRAAIAPGRDDYDDVDDEDGDSAGRSRSRRRRDKKHHHASRSPTPNHFVLKHMHNKLDSTERGLTYAALGAIAGGIVGNKVGKGPLSTVAGVVLGGVGANAWEARDARKKHDEHVREKKTKARRAQSEGRRYSDDEDRDIGRYGDYNGNGRDRDGGRDSGRDSGRDTGRARSSGRAARDRSGSGSYDSDSDAAYRRRKRERAQRDR